MRLSALQMNSGADRDANLAALRAAMTAVGGGSEELVVLPENFALMSEHREQRLAVAEQDGNGPIQDVLADMARTRRVWIVAGTIPLRGENPARPYASCLVYNAAGDRVGRYDKRYMFDVEIPGADESYAESSYTTAGNRTLVLDSPWGRLGIAVCYDLRFPEHFREMAAAGLDVIAIPAAFTVATGRAHWDILLRARAIENQCYVVAAAQVGLHPGGRKTWGHSRVIDPWGNILADAGNQIGKATAAYDKSTLMKLRAEFPVLQHRRQSKQ
jgi:nitrilase